MSLDLGAGSLEVAIALSFVFFLLSVVVSACTEGISWALRLRAKNLKKGIKGLLGETVGGEVLEHPLVKTDVTSTSKRKEPAYVSARNFALAMLQTISTGERQAARSIDEAREVIAAMDDSPLGRQLKALVDDGEADLKTFRASVETWFNDGMDRVSGWYKRRAQFITCVLAVLVAGGLNVDAIRVGERIANDPTVRTAIVTQAEKKVAEPTGDGATAADGKPKSDLVKAGEDAEGAVDELKALELPILWGGDNEGIDLTSIAGWLITAIAISLGSPFWFDALGKLARLRTTGAQPKAGSQPDPA